MDCGKPIINPNRLRFMNIGLVNMGMVYGLGRVGNCRVNFLLYQSHLMNLRSLSAKFLKMSWDAAAVSKNFCTTSFYHFRGLYEDVWGCISLHGMSQNEVLLGML